MQTPLQMDFWLQSYEGFVNAKNKTKQRNLNAVFANISKTTSPTSDSFLLIMSHICQISFVKQMQGQHSSLGIEQREICFKAATFPLQMILFQIPDNLPGLKQDFANFPESKKIYNNKLCYVTFLLIDFLCYLLKIAFLLFWI